MIKKSAPKVYSNYKVYIQAYDSFKWGGDSEQYLGDISLYDDCKYPYFKTYPSDIHI